MNIENKPSPQFPGLEYQFPTKTLWLNSDLFINYIDEGSGDTVILFIHGMGSYIPAWDRNIPELSRTYRCIAIDLPGYGLSSEGVYPGTMEFYSDIIEDFLQRLKIERAVLCGHSMGGQIAITTAIRFPGLVDKLALVNPAGFEMFTDEEIYWLQKYFNADIISAADVNQVRLNFKRNFYDMPGETEKMIEDRVKISESKNFRNYCEVVANSFIGMLEQPVFDSLHDIKCKTLILFGDKDDLIPHPYLHKDLTPESVAKTGHGRIPGSELIVIPGCGHFMQFERPEMFNGCITEFISKNSPG